ncbi:MAG: hypothetical protein HQL26_04915 [Candidatus Omnitrophica bacterium]|nr:hypothetical protein [Candidatus Omnitrophota bacterium]
MNRKVFTIILTAVFILNSISFIPLASAQKALVLPAPGEMVNLSSNYQPSTIAGIQIAPDNPFHMDFIVQKGQNQLAPDEKDAEYNKLIKYFLASLTVPDRNQWVNLSPYESNRIIATDFGQTEMGRDLLGQDYILKQITSTLFYPEGKIGQKFWDEVYSKISLSSNKLDIPINTFNKVWIVPDEALVYERTKDNTVWILSSHLKVMLEQDYMAAQYSRMGGQVPEKSQSVEPQTLDLIRKNLIPIIEKEVNEGEHFAKLRQIYNSMILATWYKTKLKNSVLNRVYSDQSKVTGIELADPKENNEIYQQYLKAFKQGVFNLVKEEYDPVQQTIIPRKYFSGGFDKGALDRAMKVVKDTDSALMSNELKKELSTAEQAMAMNDYDKVNVGMLEKDGAMLDTQSKTALGIISTLENRNKKYKVNLGKTLREKQRMLDFCLDYVMDSDFQDVVTDRLFHNFNDPVLAEFINGEIEHADSTHYFLASVINAVNEFKPGEEIDEKLLVKLVVKHIRIYLVPKAEIVKQKSIKPVPQARITKAYSQKNQPTPKPRPSVKQTAKEMLRTAAILTAILLTIHLVAPNFERDMVNTFSLHKREQVSKPKPAPILQKGRVVLIKRVFAPEPAEKISKPDINSLEYQRDAINKYFEEYAIRSQKYLDSLSYANKTPLTGEMLARYAKKWYLITNKVFPYEVALAMGEQESHHGTDKEKNGKKIRDNIFSVAWYDSGRKDKWINNVEIGVDAFYKLMTNDYLEGNSPEALERMLENMDKIDFKYENNKSVFSPSNFKNQRYSSDRLYEQYIKSLSIKVLKISGDYNYENYLKELGMNPGDIYNNTVKLINKYGPNLDRAVLAKTEDKVGGIDLNSQLLNLNIKTDGQGIPLPLNQQDLAQIQNIKGLSPRIYQIIPLLDQEKPKLALE